jgi:hypothetical protein
MYDKGDNVIIRVRTIRDGIKTLPVRIISRHDGSDSFFSGDIFNKTSYVVELESGARHLIGCDTIISYNTDIPKRIKKFKL